MLKNKIWDAPAYDRNRRRYSKSSLSIIFDNQLESDKSNKYSLGRISLAARQILDLPRHRISYKDSEGYNPIPLEDNSGNIGRIIQENNLWKYESLAEYSVISSATPQTSKVIYYTDRRLKSLSSGLIWRGLYINSLASLSYDIVAPPEFLLRQELKRDIAVKAYGAAGNYREAYILSRLDSSNPADDLLFYSIVSNIKKYSEAWQKYLLSSATPLFNGIDNSRTVLENYLDLIDSCRGAVLLEDLPKYSRAQVDLDKKYARPIYGRLPNSYQESTEDIIVLENLNDRFKLSATELDVGTFVTDKLYGRAYKYLPRRIKTPEEKYKYGLDPLDPDQVNSPADPESWKVPATPPAPPISDWLTSGTDLLLSSSKEKIDQFFHDILDPQTCKDSALDWISQFFGFTDDLWREDWSAKEKRAVLLNAFGWFDSTLKNDRQELTLKGEILSQYPFSDFTQTWVDSETAEENLFNLVGHTIELYTLAENQNDLGTFYELSPQTDIKINKENWLGLHESKGTLINLMWWLSNFNIQALNSATEIEDLSALLEYEIEPVNVTNDNNNRGASTTNENIRVINTTIPPSTQSKLVKPIIISQAQTVEQEEVEFTSNPLIAGITPIFDEPYVIIPLSYKYSKFDPIWDKIDYVLGYWAPTFTKTRVQYPFITADYSVAGDAFFEPV